MKDNVKKTIEALNSNGFNVKYFETSKEAVDDLLKEVPVDVAVGFGGSATTSSLEISSKMSARGNTVYDHSKVKDPAERFATLKNAGSTPVYISGTNAITEDGKIVNMDGTGNRVASMIFGHDKVYLVCGTNKLVKDVDTGLKRINEVVAVKNAQRLGRTVEDISRVTVIFDKALMYTSMTVYLIEEELGY